MLHRFYLWLPFWPPFCPILCSFALAVCPSYLYSLSGTSTRLSPGHTVHSTFENCVWTEKQTRATRTWSYCEWICGGIWGWGGLMLPWFSGLSYSKGFRLWPTNVGDNTHCVLSVVYSPPPSYSTLLFVFSLHLTFSTYSFSIFIFLNYLHHCHLCSFLLGTELP